MENGDINIQMFLMELGRLMQTVRGLWAQKKLLNVSKTLNVKTVRDTIE